MLKTISAVSILMMLALSSCGIVDPRVHLPTPSPSLIPTASATPLPMAPESEQVLRTGLLVGSLGTFTLDPAFVLDNSSYSVSQLVFPGLVQLDSHLRVVSWGASGYQISADGKTYTFSIRAGMTWSDGTPISAGDFAFSINRALDPCINSNPYPAEFLYPIQDSVAYHTEQCLNGRPSGSLQTLVGDSIIVQDAQTLVIRLETPASRFLTALTHPVAHAVPQSLTQAYGSDWTNHLTTSYGSGTGFGGDLFKIQSWQPNKELVLARNERFWGNKARLQQIIFALYAEPQDQGAADMYKDYLSGQNDVSVVGRDQINSADQGQDLHSIGTLDTTYIAMNWTQAPFDNVKMRQAFALALDKNRLVQDVYGPAVSPTNHIVPNGMPGYNPNLKGPDGTPSVTGNQLRAMSLAQTYRDNVCAKSYANCPPVVLTVSIDPYLEQLAHEAEDLWQQAMPSYPIEVQELPFENLQSQLTARTLQMWIYTYSVDYPDPQNMLSNQFLPGAQLNAGNVNVQEANTLMSEADIEQNREARLSEYNQAEQLLVTQVGWIPLFHSEFFFVSKPYVANYQVAALGWPSEDVWGQIYITLH